MTSKGPIVAAMDFETEVQQREGVAVCFVWPDPSRNKQPEDLKGDPSHYLPPKAELGRSQLRGSYDGEQGYRGGQQRDPYDTTLQALRGWPRQDDNKPKGRPPGPGSRADDINFYEYDVTGGRDSEYLTLEEYNAIDAKRTPDKGKKNKKKNKDPDVPYTDDPHMGDLIAHRWLNKQSAGSRSNSASSSSSSRQKKVFPEGKPTKASQLRQLRIDEKLRPEPDARDLWQIPKFQQNAKAHVSSFRKSEVRPGVEADEDDIHMPVDDAVTGGGKRVQSKSSRINTPFGRDSDFDYYAEPTEGGGHDAQLCVVGNEGIRPEDFIVHQEML